MTVTATEAQNEFGRVFDSAVRDQVVVITKHNTPRVVLLVDRPVQRPRCCPQRRRSIR